MGCLESCAERISHSKIVKADVPFDTPTAESRLTRVKQQSYLSRASSVFSEGTLGSRAPAIWHYPYCEEQWLKSCDKDPGSSQSPIDLPESLLELPFSFKFTMDYTSIPVDLWNNGSTIIMNIPEGQTISLDDGRKYMLDQYHFHTQSEHTISGVKYKLEMQLVHVLVDGEQLLDSDILIIGVFFESNGIVNDFLESFWEFLPDADIQMCYNPTEKAELSLLVDSLEGSSFYQYKGSLTIPPLSEKVTWVVAKQPMNCTNEQVDIFIRNLGYDGNFRPPQPLSGRSIYRAEMIPSVHGSEV